MARDGNDVLREGGEEAILDQLAKAKPYKPKKPKANGNDNGAVTMPPELVKPVEPAPHEIQGLFMVVRKTVNVGDKELQPGIYFDEREGDTAEGEDVEHKWISFSTLIEPLARSRDRESKNWGVLLEVHHADGGRHVWAMPMTISPTVGDGTEFRRELGRLGHRTWGRKARNRLSDFITMWRPKRKVRCVAVVGWYGDAFVMPDKTYGGAEEIILQTEGVTPQFSTAGTLDAWRAEIARLCAGNSRLVFAVSGAFVGPLLRLAGEESGGANFRGPSSIGKSTMLHAARSVWGVPLGSWRTTDNAAESIAAGASDTFLNLDELGQADPRVIGAVSYMLGNQRGKARMTRNATARAALQWRVFFLSTGEVSLSDRLREGGIKARAGQEVRVLDVPADAGAGMGIFEELHGHNSPGGLAEYIRLAADKNCGWPALTYIERVVSEVELLPAEIARTRDAFIDEYCPKDADGQVRRACGRFAMVGIAGELATQADITGWTPGDAIRASVRMFRDWLGERGGHGSAEAREGIASVRAFLEQHGEARFTPAWEQAVTVVTTDGSYDTPDSKARPTINRAGFRKTENGETTFYVLPEVWRTEVCKGHDAKEVAKAMIGKGWMQREDERHLACKPNIPGIGRTRVYLVSPNFLSADADA